MLFSVFLWYLGRFELSNSIILLSLFSLLFLNLLFVKDMEFRLENLLKSELIFVASFLFFSLLRALSPEILYTGGEKFMEFAILKALTVSEKLPIEDVWFSGEEMSYYYLGYLPFASLSKLLNVPAEIAFNLAAATLPALTIQMAYEFGERLTKRELGGAALVYFLCFSGSLKISPNYWNFSRVIPNTINEFPAFSFIHADLHPHMISIPFQLLTIILLYVFYERRSHEAFLLVLILLHSFIFLNSWEFPTYTFLTLLVLMVLRDYAKAPFLALPLLFFLPFRTSFFERSLGIVHETTSLVHYLLLYGLFISIFYFSLLRSFRKSDLWVLPISLILFLTGYQVPAILIPLAPVIKRKRSYESFLLLTGIILSILIELIYVDDPLGAPYERMNTVFKFGLQNWILWSIPAAKLLSEVRGFALKLLIPLLILSSIFFPLAVVEKSYGSEELTLNGLKYLEESHPWDLEAASFLSSRERGVILELYGDSYTYSSQFSTLTGYPSVLGWRGHEIMWRGFDDVMERQKDLLAMYHGDLELMKSYHVRYLIFEEREREFFGDLSFNFTLIYENKKVKIYELPYSSPS